MNKEFLKGISKENKRDFLNKLQSGKFNLSKPYDPQPKLTFNLQGNGLYKCQETGQELTSQEIAFLPGYRMNIELVSDRLQVAGEKPPDSIIKVPFTQEEYLNSLLINKSAKVLTFDESDGKFKTETESYSFENLMRINTDFVMDEATAREYVSCLEKWC